MAIITTRFGLKDAEAPVIQYDTGAVRSPDDDKPQFTWNPPEAIPYSKTSSGLWYRQSYTWNNVGFDVEHGDPIVGTAPFQETDETQIPRIYLNRLGAGTWHGEQKHGRDNWKKGMNLARTFASVIRHLIQWWAGDTGEDHLGAAGWGLATLMWTENELYEGRLPESYADCGPLKGFRRVNK